MKRTPQFNAASRSRSLMVWRMIKADQQRLADTLNGTARDVKVCGGMSKPYGEYPRSPGTTTPVTCA